MEIKVSVSDKSIGFPRALRDMFSDAGFILPLVGAGGFYPVSEFLRCGNCRLRLRNSFGKKSSFFLRFLVFCKMSMKTIAVIDCLKNNRFSREPLSGGCSAERLCADAVLSAFRSGRIDGDVVRLSETPEAAGGIRTVAVSAADAGGYFDALAKITEGYDVALRVCGDAPFVSPALILETLREHTETAADFTYGEGFPLGLCPEAIETDLLPILAELNRNAPLPHRSLFPYFEKQINDYDIAVVIAPQDSRRLRLSLFADSFRRLTLLTRLAAASNGAVTPSFIAENEKLLLVPPAFYPIQIVDARVQTPIYVPQALSAEAGSGAEMSVESLRLLLRRAEEVSGSFVVSLSMNCDPVCHSRFFEAAQAALESKASAVLIETAGLRWDAERAEALTAAAAGRLIWIVLLDAGTEEDYRKLRGEGFAEASAFAARMTAAFPKSVYVQAHRLKGYESAADAFYRVWKPKTDRLIIQKHDSFCGLVPEMKAVDLSPLKRFPCHRLKRELPVLSDGTVPMCSEDLSRTVRRGNALTDDWQTLFASVRRQYEEQVDGIYNGICGGCDEYYTFNF